MAQTLSPPIQPNLLNGQAKMLEARVGYCRLWNLLLLSIYDLIYLKKMYNQNNSTRHFELEYEISNYTQGNMSIQEYYTGFITLWIEYTDIVYASIPAASLEDIQTIHQTRQRDKFLVKLRHVFESVCSNLLVQISSLSLDVCLNELLREEQHHLTQTTLEQQESSTNVLNFAHLLK